MMSNIVDDFSPAMWYNSIMGWRHAAAARNLFIFTGR